MEPNIDNIKELTSIPNEYIYNPKVIEYLYQNNPNVFKNVDKTLNLSFEFQEKLTKLINDRTIILTENNIKLLDSLFSGYIIDILNNNFQYIYLINENNFNSIGITRDDNFIELLESEKIVLNDKTPYLVTKCADYIIKQYINDKVNITDVLPYFTNWYQFEQRILIQEYLNKGNSDLSIFKTKDIYNNDKIISVFNNIIIEKEQDVIKVKTIDVNSIIYLLSFELPFNITDVYLLDNNMSDNEILSLLEITNEQNINLHVKNGLSITSNLENNCRFLELCGNVGNIKLFPFELDEFKKLLLKAEEHPGVVINIDLDDFMENENFLINLNTEVPINVISERNVTILSLNEMKKLNQKLDLIVDEIKHSTLSSYEKYIAAYNIVKSFEKYRFYLDNEGFDELITDQSRNPYLILINQYIVCAGYTSLLQILLKKLDIPSHEWILNISENSEAVANGNLTNNDCHARLCINIVDNKYKINGYFMSDPTFDSVSKENKDLFGYQYLSMSVGESHDYGKNTSSYYYFSNDYKAFNDQMFINTSEYLNTSSNLDEILEILLDLDPQFYTELLTIKNIEAQKDAIQNHFKSKTYRPISLKTKYEAIISVLEFQNKQVFSELEKLELYEKLYNIARGIDVGEPIIISFDYDDFEDWIDFGDNPNNKKR